ncbi:MAG TPA: PaeR7I family type II restriction endonuclease [Pirellulales bacterium]|jgi:hypothetical protein|nr:PaeR7I family type II restriction endonuclease [Pirellulales bacterium]
MRDVERRVGEAIKLFWLVRDKQSQSQGTSSGSKDAGLRAAVTGGKHLDGFAEICRDLFIAAGVPEAHVYWKAKRKVPGYYRAEKDWDLVVVADGHLLALLEFKAQVGPSFGNNFNNRTEEALGNATDDPRRRARADSAPRSDHCDPVMMAPRIGRSFDHRA